ncbi:MAG: Rhodanese-related sulfurtransferase [Clostridia bacterium]|jgi:rhodanese-related sulfurtransferase|nr:Rhodanese-related sulfurtransferase [Clostridia bacterium]
MNLVKILKMLIIIAVLITVIIYVILINSSITNDGNVGGKMEKAEYIKIASSQMVEEIKNMNEKDYVILDVRTKQEYDLERIPNSILLTLDEIESEADVVLPDENVKIYVYCRTGRRSLAAAYKLIELGYKYVYDIGGIEDYPYEKVK